MGVVAVLSEDGVARTGAEMRTLSEAWHRARSGGPGVFLLVAGESGVGKTWLTASFAREHVPDEQLLWGI